MRQTTDTSQSQNDDADWSWRREVIQSKTNQKQHVDSGRKHPEGGDKLGPGPAQTTIQIILN